MKTHRILVKIPLHDWETFKENYPMQGSFTWFVRECMLNFNDLHKDSPADLIRSVVEAVKEEIEG